MNSRFRPAWLLLACAAPALGQPCDEWRSLEAGISGATGGANWIYALTTFGGELIVGGNFTSAGGVSASRIAAWNGDQWRALGTGINGNVHSLAVYNGELIAGGGFTIAGGQSASRIAAWDGEEWRPLGAGMHHPNFPAWVSSLTTYKGELIAGGAFISAGGQSANRIAAWNGVSWRPLGAGVSHPNFEARVSSLAKFDGELIAGGDFVLAGGQIADRIAAWNGESWRPLGSGVGGVSGLSEPGVGALITYNGELIAAGNFTIAGSSAADRIAAWDGMSWRPLGTGLTNPLFAASVSSLTIYHGDLVVGGNFAVAGGQSADRIAAWDGSGWRSLGIGMEGHTARSLATYSGELIAGRVCTVSSECLTAWLSCATTCYPNCDNSTTEPILNVDDFTCFINSFAVGMGLPHEAQLGHYANCDGSTTAPVLNVDDFTCFINAFAAGCR